MSWENIDDGGGVLPRRMRHHKRRRHPLAWYACPTPLPWDDEDWGDGGARRETNGAAAVDGLDDADGDDAADRNQSVACAKWDEVAMARLASFRTYPEEELPPPHHIPTAAVLRRIR